MEEDGQIGWRGRRGAERLRDRLAVRCGVMMAGGERSDSAVIHAPSPLYIDTLCCAHKNTHGAERRSL